MYGDLGIRLINNKYYDLIFALFFSIATALFFTVFAYEYGVLAYELQESKTQEELFLQAKRIVFEMDRFDPNVEKIFYFPRYELYRTALIQGDGSTLFSTLTFKPDPSVGYHAEETKRYYVYLLPEGKYFNATYLVVSKEFFESEIYYRLLFFLLVGVSLIFAISWYLIRLFEKPLIRMNENMDRFVRDSIHEINTPLSIITANIELFSMKHPKEDRHLLRIQGAAKSLGSLFSDMEYLLKHDQGSLKREYTDIGEATLQRVEYFTEVAQMKNIRLITEVPKGYIADINRLKLYHLIDNNLSNAIKYSWENSVIEVRWVKISEDKGSLTFKDYGVGIRNPDKIFERYYREELSKGGFGLGLNIVKRISEEENITIEVDSHPNEGSEFRYVFLLKN